MSDDMRCGIAPEESEGKRVVLERIVSKQIFICGRGIADTEKGAVWEILGAFTSAEKAEFACYDDKCFVGPLPVDTLLPREVRAWPGVYFPLSC